MKIIDNIMLRRKKKKWNKHDMEYKQEKKLKLLLGTPCGFGKYVWCRSQHIPFRIPSVGSVCWTIWTVDLMQQSLLRKKVVLRQREKRIQILYQYQNQSCYECTNEHSSLQKYRGSFNSPQKTISKQSTQLKPINSISIRCNIAYYKMDFYFK